MRNLDKYPYSLYGTQGGGLARREGSRFIFIEAPDITGLEVGDDVPDQWDLIPANKNARDENAFNQDLDAFFTEAEHQVETDQMALVSLGNLFPAEMMA